MNLEEAAYYEYDLQGTDFVKISQNVTTNYCIVCNAKLEIYTHSKSNLTCPSCTSDLSSPTANKQKVYGASKIKTE